MSEVALGQDEVIVVSPHNAQVRCLRGHLDADALTDVRLGTVDKFQGQGLDEMGGGCRGGTGG